MSGRLELAQWIADKSNPLTYRVYINRVWKVLFGQGIIDSFDNFGSLGGEPTNAKIMDYLVIKFIQKKYSTKALLKEIIMSDSYQMSTRFDKDNYEKDPDNLYFWRMNEKRLEAENIRDTLLYIAKELNPTKKNHDFTFNNDKGRLDGKINGELNSAKYRSVYLPVPRDFDIEMLEHIKKFIIKPIIVSGGCGSINDIIKIKKKFNYASVALASLLHYNKIKISKIKEKINS
jgi:hypothetical protein